MANDGHVKERVIELVESLPDDVTLQEVGRQIVTLAMIDEGIDQADSGQVVKNEQVIAWLESWGSEDEREPPR